MGKNNVKTCRIGKVPKSFRYAYSFCKFLFLPQWGKGIPIYDKQQGNVEEREAERNMDDGRGSFNYPKEPLRKNIILTNFTMQFNTAKMLLIYC